ncbi:MAG: tRNA (adenosine(37)-N6)-threonylcarbamoyltransferase complex transferase subunit TsaD [Verrucomicrobia bacterium]|nr:tRNA (adenosine(37)-N6)-threonylcarbamoyltransferase complex transferase subunit TsaD [Verrucomicrobiota bacterium]
MLVLGIESTCDETGVAIVEDGKRILANVVASSADIHRQYGGVFPELACRRHIDALLPVLDEAFRKAGVDRSEIDLVAVAQGPGLIGALLIGMNAAKGLAIAWNKPLIGVNHVEAHLYASFMGKEDPEFPALGIVLSGGHTLLLKVHGIGEYEPIATTVDDAIGEAFDKVAALLSLPYPGGPEIERIAREGNPEKFPFRAGFVKKSPLDFSFSGLKTSVLYALKGQNGVEKNISLTDKTKADVAASFQETALGDVVEKAKKAIQSFECRSIILGGGVCNNERLKKMFEVEFQKIPILWPPKGLTLDNAAMIAGLGFHKFLRKEGGDPLDLDALTRIPIG